MSRRLEVPARRFQFTDLLSSVPGAWGYAPPSHDPADGAERDAPPPAHRRRQGRASRFSRAWTNSAHPSTPLLRRARPPRLSRSLPTRSIPAARPSSVHASLPRSLRLTRIDPCPSPRELHRSALQLPVLEPSPLAYLALPSLSPHFNVSFAHSPLSCNTFHLRIARRNSTHCLDALRLPDPSLDPELSSYVRRTLGPDSFRVVVDGAQKFATEEPTYEEESCSWRFDVQLRAVDEVRVKLWWMYEVSTCSPLRSPARSATL